MASERDENVWMRAVYYSNYLATGVEKLHFQTDFIFQNDFLINSDLSADRSLRISCSFHKNYNVS